MASTNSSFSDNKSGLLCFAKVEEKSEAKAVEVVKAFSKFSRKIIKIDFKCLYHASPVVRNVK